MIVAHVRLLTELKDRADHLREERYGPEALPRASRAPAIALESDSPASLT